MIVDGIDISTQQGCDKFNEKHQCWCASISEDGGVELKAVDNTDHLPVIYLGTGTLFESPIRVDCENDAVIKHQLSAEQKSRLFEDDELYRE